MEQTNVTELQKHLRWALEELDRHVTIGGDGVARNRCEGQVVDGYTDAYSAAKKAITTPKLEVGRKVWIDFPSDPGYGNGYTGKATLLEWDTFDGEISWRVAIPSGDDEGWFPEDYIIALL